MIRLKGITWNHSRAFPPVVAAAQRFEETHPGTEIVWQRRSLHEFGHADIAELARHFDLLVIDHPWLGLAVAADAFAPLDELLPPAFVREISAIYVGASCESYVLDGRLYAVPIDAASPVACHVPGTAPPHTWEETIALARRGEVVIPGFHVDLLLNFIGLCVTAGGAPFSEDRFIDRSTGSDCLERMRELVSLMPDAALSMNPIAVYEALSGGGGPWRYCPFAYGYSNYARDRFAAMRLSFTNPPSVGGHAFRGVLGGAGLAISKRCTAPGVAAGFACYLAGADCQSTIYFYSGGQPARREAWKDPRLDRAVGGFFSRTCETIERAWIRPRYKGFLAFQETAGIPLMTWLRNGGDTARLFDELDGLFRHSLRQGAAT